MFPADIFFITPFVVFTTKSSITKMPLKQALSFIMIKYLAVIGSVISIGLVGALLFLPRVVCACITDVDMFVAHYDVDPKHLDSAEIIRVVSEKYPIGSASYEMKDKIIAFERNCIRLNNKIECVYKMKSGNIVIQFTYGSGVLESVEASKA